MSFSCKNMQMTKWQLETFHRNAQCWTFHNVHCFIVWQQNASAMCSFPQQLFLLLVLTTGPAELYQPWRGKRPSEAWLHTEPSGQWPNLSASRCDPGTEDTQAVDRGATWTSTMREATSHLDLGQLHGAPQRSHGDHQVDHQGAADGFADRWWHEGTEGRGVISSCCVEHEAAVLPRLQDWCCRHVAFGWW